MTENIIECRNVSIVFGDAPRRALPLMQAGVTRAEIQTQTNQVLGAHQCSFDVPEGEILVLMGLSGSGKSTLLRAINGLNPVIEGAVRVRRGETWMDVARASALEVRDLRRNHVAMVFQQFGLLPWRSVRQNVGFGLELAGRGSDDINARVDEQLELVGLSQWADRAVSELSGGMQQRVGLARAFATHAPILLMDEPFSALDPLIRTKLQDELLSLQKRLGVTIVFVSHDLDEAFKLGNKIAILKEGRMVQMGSPRDIFNAPADPYVADFVQHMNPMNVLLARDVLEPSRNEAGPEIDADTPMSEVIEKVLASPSPLRVMENGTCIGTLAKEDILKRLHSTPKEA